MNTETYWQNPSSTPPGASTHTPNQQRRQKKNMTSGATNQETSMMIMDDGGIGSGGGITTTTTLFSFLDILQQDAQMGKLSVAAARPIVIKLIAHPNIFFGFDQVKAVLSSSGINDPSILSTLDLFSYGNLKHCTSNIISSSSFMGLNDQAISKLAQLTVMSCIHDASSRGMMSITYNSLAESLGWNDEGPVVDVLIQCVYADVLKGKLCQKTRTFGWDGESLPVVCPRDVPPSQIANMLDVLRGLEYRLNKSVEDLKGNESTVLKQLEEDVNYWKIIQERRKNAQAEGASKSFSMEMGPRGGGPGGGVGGPGGGATGQFQIPNDFRGRQTGHRSSKRSRGTTNVVDGFRM